MKPAFVARGNGHAFFDDTAAAYRFIRRQKVARGSDPGPDIGPSDWQPGDYAKFIPDIMPGMERHNRASSRDLILSVCGFAIAAGCFWWVGLM
ncbi:hypothetical protein [Mesorhizobium sp. A556]